MHDCGTAEKSLQIYSARIAPVDCENSLSPAEGEAMFKQLARLALHTPALYPLASGQCTLLQNFTYSIEGTQSKDSVP